MPQLLLTPLLCPPPTSFSDPSTPLAGRGAGVRALRFRRQQHRPRHRNPPQSSSPLPARPTSLDSFVPRLGEAGEGASLPATARPCHTETRLNRHRPTPSPSPTSKPDPSTPRLGEGPGVRALRFRRQHRPRHTETRLNRHRLTPLSQLDQPQSGSQTFPRGAMGTREYAIDRLPSPSPPNKPRPAVAPAGRGRADGIGVRASFGHCAGGSVGGILVAIDGNR